MSTTAVADPLVHKKGPTPPMPWDREAFQVKVREAIRNKGGAIRGGNIREIANLLGFKKVATRRVQSALWHLTELGVLRYTKLTPEGLNSPFDELARDHHYRLVRP